MSCLLLLLLSLLLPATAQATGADDASRDARWSRGDVAGEARLLLDTLPGFGKMPDCMIALAIFLPPNQLVWIHKSWNQFWQQ